MDIPHLLRHVLQWPLYEKRDRTEMSGRTTKKEKTLLFEGRLKHSFCNVIAQLPCFLSIIKRNKTGLHCRLYVCWPRGSLTTPCLV